MADMTLAEAARLVGPQAKQAKALVNLAEAAEVIVKAESINRGLLTRQKELGKSLEDEQTRVGKAKIKLEAEFKLARAEHQRRISAQDKELADITAATDQALDDHNKKMAELGKALATRVKDHGAQIKKLDAEIGEHKAKRAAAQEQFNDIRKRLKAISSNLGDNG